MREREREHFLPVLLFLLMPPWSCATSPRVNAHPLSPVEATTEDRQAPVAVVVRVAPVAPLILAAIDARLAGQVTIILLKTGPRVALCFSWEITFMMTQSLDESLGRDYKAGGVEEKSSRFFKRNSFLLMRGWRGQEGVLSTALLILPCAVSLFFKSMLSRVECLREGQ